MKKIFIILTLAFFASTVFAFEIPEGKTVNKDAVISGIENYSKKILANPTSQDAYINRAFLLFLSNNISAAISDYDKLIELNPNNEEFYLNRGYLKHISNKRLEALEDYNAALRIKPDYAFAYNNKGVVLAEIGKTEDSLKAYNTAIDLDPNYSDAYYNRGNLNTRIENNEKALQDFNTAIKLNPKDSASFNNRGVVKRKLNYNVGALSDFSIAIRLNPDDITALANRGRLKKRYFDSEGAEEDFKTAINVAEESPNIIQQIEAQGQIVASKNPILEDKPNLEKSKISNDNIQKIAYISEENKENNSVKATVVKVDPKSNKASEIKPAKISQEPVIATKPVANPKLAECYYIRALQKYILQNREGALKDFNSAIDFNPEYAEAYYYRAAIKRDLKDEGFIDDYRKAVKLNPDLKAIDEANVLNILKI